MTIKWEDIIAETTSRILEDMYHPLIPREPILEKEIPKIETAYFNFITNRRHISKKFLNDLVENGGVDPRTAVRGIEKHEIGHYTDYPRELATVLTTRQYVEAMFKEDEDIIVA